MKIPKKKTTLTTALKLLRLLPYMLNSLADDADDTGFPQRADNARAMASKIKRFLRSL